MRYFRVLWRACENSLSYLLAYRADVLMKILLGLGWTLVNLGIIEIIFSHTAMMDGWSKLDVILLVFTFGIATEPSFILGSYIKELETNIRLGVFDGIITKPIDSQFFSLFARPNFSTLLYLVSRQAPYLYILAGHHLRFPLQTLLVYLLLILFANIIWLALSTILMTINFWHQKLDNISELQMTISEFAKYPAGIYPRGIQLIMYTVVPLAFTAFVPVQALRGTLTFRTFLLTLAIAIGFVLCSRLLWQKAIRNYTSASS